MAQMGVTLPDEMVFVRERCQATGLLWHHGRVWRGCRRGEEVTHCYDERYERPDFALINSFFLPPHEDLLAAVDLPGGSLEGTFPGPDADHFPSYSLSTEVARIAARLEAFPTSELEDLVLLRKERRWWHAGSGLGFRQPLDAVARRIVDFRLRRKRALRRAMRELRERLDNIHSRLAGGGRELRR